MKNYFKMVVAILLLVSLLSACGKSAKSPQLPSGLAEIEIPYGTIVPDKQAWLEKEFEDIIYEIPKIWDENVSEEDHYVEYYATYSEGVYGSYRQSDISSYQNCKNLAFMSKELGGIITNEFFIKEQELQDIVAADIKEMLTSIDGASNVVISSSEIIELSGLEAVQFCGNMQVDLLSAYCEAICFIYNSKLYAIFWVNYSESFKADNERYFETFKDSIILKSEDTDTDFYGTEELDTIKLGGIAYEVPQNCDFDQKASQQQKGFDKGIVYTDTNSGMKIIAGIAKTEDSISNDDLLQHSEKFISGFAENLSAGTVSDVEILFSGTTDVAGMEAARGTLSFRMSGMSCKCEVLGFIYQANYYSIIFYMPHSSRLDFSNDFEAFKNSIRVYHER